MVRYPTSAEMSGSTTIHKTISIVSRAHNFLHIVRTLNNWGFAGGMHLRTMKLVQETSQKI